MHSKRYYFIFICQLFTCLTFINIFQMDSEIINDTIILISTFLFTYVFENVYSFLAFLPVKNQSEFLRIAEMHFVKVNNSAFILIILMFYLYKTFSSDELKVLYNFTWLFQLHINYFRDNYIWNTRNILLLFRQQKIKQHNSVL